MKNNSQTPLYPVYDTGELSVTISKGNTKMGNIPNFNTLPGNKPLTKSNGKPLTNIKGTCGKYCGSCFKYCYAVKFVRFHNNSTVRVYAMNTLIMRNDPEKLKRAIKEYCEKNVVKYFRYHTSGEVESVSQMETYTEICKENPDVVFYLYTKAFDILNEWFEQHKSIPDNLVINLSQWHNKLTDLINPFLLSLCNVFAYDDGESGQEVEDMIHCPAVDKQGHETGITCAQCRRCMKRGNSTAVYSH